VNYLVVILICVIICTGFYSFVKETHRNEIENLKITYSLELEKYKKEFLQRSDAVRRGFCVETFVPFTEQFPVPAEDVSFLGKPIDFVGFTDTNSRETCTVHFIEVKSGKSKLTTKQRNIKTAIQQGRVKWHEVVVQEKSYT